VVDVFEDKKDTFLGDILGAASDFSCVQKCGVVVNDVFTYQVVFQEK
jgi:hypothetical protein